MMNHKKFNFLKANITSKKKPNFLIISIAAFKYALFYHPLYISNLNKIKFLINNTKNKI